MTMGDRTGWEWVRCAVGSALAVAVGCASPLEVDRTDDEPSASACVAGVPADCSLRGAILNANRTPGPATIELPAGLYRIDVVGANEDGAESGDLDITDDLTITGIADPSGAPPAISPIDSYDRVFDVDPGRSHPTVALAGLAIQGGLFIPMAPDDPAEFPYGAAIANFGANLSVVDTRITPGLAAGGAGIYNEATLTLTDSVIENGFTPSAMPFLFVAGAAIANGDPASGAAGGVVTIERTRILGVSGYRFAGPGANVVEGGAIYNGAGGTMVVRQSTVDGSWIESWSWLSVPPCGPAVHGGGIANRGELWIEDSTLSNDELRTAPGIRCESRGGALFNAASAALVNVTLSGNRANESGGAIHNEGTLVLAHVSAIDSVAGTGAPGDVALASASGSVELVSSLIADGCFGTGFVSDGGNLESPGNGCGFDQPTDQVGVADLRVGPLADNGGPTWTHALLAGSPAIDAGLPAACPLTDQRGAPRNDGACDSGAYEHGAGASID